MVMSGVIATIATMPKASASTFSSPLNYATRRLLPKGKIKVVVRGPDATPAESNAIAVYTLGTKKLNPNDTM